MPHYDAVSGTQTTARGIRLAIGTAVLGTAIAGSVLGFSAHSPLGSGSVAAILLILYSLGLNMTIAGAIDYAKNS